MSFVERTKSGAGAAGAGGGAASQQAAQQAALQAAQQRAQAAQAAAARAGGGGGGSQLGRSGGAGFGGGAAAPPSSSPKEALNKWLEQYTNAQKQGGAAKAKPGARAPSASTKQHQAPRARQPIRAGSRTRNDPRLADEDEDKDGRADHIHEDYDGDGVYDVVHEDTDGDGIFDTVHEDTDGDGSADLVHEAPHLHAHPPPTTTRLLAPPVPCGRRGAEGCDCRCCHRT